MKYYISSGLSNKEIVNETINQINDLGYKNTYNWTLNEKVVDINKLKKIGNDELKAVQQSEVLIVSLSGERDSY